MFGAFRATNALSGGLLWCVKNFSRPAVTEDTVATFAIPEGAATGASAGRRRGRGDVDQALAKKGETLKALDVWKETMPTEAEMLPKDKYTMFDRKEKRTTEMDKSLTTTKPTGLLERLDALDWGVLAKRLLRRWTKVFPG
ncbi:hypothetical protein CHU98_g6146 [Xylaria longipes]|nr:hypothetical protein CHU98_g6146 [Xylaria longipes]